MPRYIDPMTDFGFKRIFANENHKEITIFLLNSLLNLDIAEIEFQTLEEPAESLELRGVIYDILCKDSQGREFIVELQRAKQRFFTDRSIFYVCRHLNAQLKKGESGRDKFKLLPIYFLGILGFNTFEGDEYIRNGTIRDDQCNKLSETINFTYVELLKFNTETPETEIEKLLYFFKYSYKFRENIFPEQPFSTIFNIASYYNLSDAEQLKYDTMLNRELANIDAVETAKEEGREEGRMEGEKLKQLEIAKNLLDILDIKTISLKTGLTISEIENL
jgi:predicted transposase/invertase (TIGR01784 family)